jgi:electron transfer flavoprotein alpha subunit
MSVLIYIDHADGLVKKVSHEALSYGAALAKAIGTTAEGLVLGKTSGDLAVLGIYGITKVHQVTHANLDQVDAQVFAALIADAAIAVNASVVIFSNNINGKAIAPRVSVRLKAGLVSGAVSLPDLTNGFVVRKSVFSGKAFARVEINTPIKVIAVNPNAYPVHTLEGQAEVVALNLQPRDSRIKVTATNKTSGKVALSEADLVVSAGRGLKGPENWGMVEELAELLGAATACSRPVADAHWRPHHEHVGQTGLAIAPNLYIAIGISGAIQHLAGVNRSKVIVVINKDPEAPFFKAADYGIVGDAFEVVPKIITAVRKLKGIA